MATSTGCQSPILTSVTSSVLPMAIHEPSGDQTGAQSCDQPSSPNPMPMRLRKLPSGERSHSADPSRVAMSLPSVDHQARVRPTSSAVVRLRTWLPSAPAIQASPSRTKTNALPSGDQPPGIGNLPMSRRSVPSGGPTHKIRLAPRRRGPRRQPTTRAGRAGRGPRSRRGEPGDSHHHTVQTTGSPGRRPMRCRATIRVPRHGAGSAHCEGSHLPRRPGTTRRLARRCSPRIPSGAQRTATLPPASNVGCGGWDAPGPTGTSVTFGA